METQAIENIAMPMPIYRCHKDVWALKIAEIRQSPPNSDPGVEKRGTWIIVPAEEGYAPFTVEQSFIDRHQPHVGGYYVVYKDGYASFSPAGAFEEGYSREAKGGGYVATSLHPEKKTAAEHRGYANSYRQTPKPPVPVAPVSVGGGNANAPFQSGAAKPNEYPKHIMAGDGVKRIAYDADHEASLKAIGKDSKLEPANAEDHQSAYRRAASHLASSLRGEPHAD
jgi:hypothetical protein